MTQHRRINPWIIALTVMIATFMEVLDTSVANVALPHIAGDLSATVEETTWVLTSYLVANAVVLPLGGYFSSLMGRKRFYLTCVSVFTVASLLCGIAPSLGWLIFFRVLQGLGGGGLQPISQAILVETFPHEKRGAAMAVYGMGVVLAPIIGPVLGGWITDNFSWHWIFLINIPVGFLSFTLTSALVQDPPTFHRISLKEGAKFDYFGIGILTLGLASLEIVLDEGQRKDWFSSGYIVFFAIIAVVALVFAVLYELRKTRPIVDFRLMKDRTFAVSILMLFVLGFVLYGSLALLPIFLQTLLGYTALLSGWVLSPGGLAIMLMMPIVAMLLKKVDTRWLIGIGFFTCGLGLIQMAGFNLQVDFSTAMWSRVLQSLGFAFLFIPINVSAFQHIPHEKTAYATGLMNLVRNIGGSTGIALATTMLARRSQVHQANLIGHLAPGNPAYQGFLDRTTQLGVLRGGLSPTDAAHLAQGAAYGTVVRQSSMMAFSDTFWFMGILCFCLFPLLFLMRRSLATGPVHVD
ncbi:DHA2 family efflux MFS transporter permease subunit [Geothrix oryzisoli]|uniref:DHA2 family efflux MFS transporter permease subunit n=1 Tax=Geothrix oryzisoli TaxID=2922721 RepID=UPI001FAD48A7